MTEDKDVFLSRNQLMLAQHIVYIISLTNLFLAGIAVVCVTHAQNHPEQFSLVYITISIFIYYMGTILIIIVLQIIQTCHEEHQTTLQISTLKTPRDSQLNTVIDKNLTISTEPNQLHLSCSQTLPLTVGLHNPHRTSSITLEEDLNNSSGEIVTTSPCLTQLPKCRQTIATIHEHY